MAYGVRGRFDYQDIAPLRSMRLFSCRSSNFWDGAGKVHDG